MNNELQQLIEAVEAARDQLKPWHPMGLIPTYESLSAFWRAQQALAYYVVGRKAEFVHQTLAELRAITRQRNEEIYKRFQRGESAAQLAVAFELSSQSIYQIIRGCKHREKRKAPL